MRASDRPGSPPRITPKPDPWFASVGEYLSMPMLLAAAPVIGCLVGWFLDRTFGTFPILTVVLLVIGFISGAREVWRRVKQSEAKK